ncbi:p78/83 [Psilogramma increta granulovirus]|uniref:P78/83 n=1 Tax=Psilogramma increta granulovirus TaxID=2953508 RepID=A0A977XU45_9BBAC|nr:p78/83 [Psilogramma increta granulovirus]
MDLLGFIRENNFNADVRDVIKFMKWNNSLKRKLDAKTDVISITTDELVEFTESVFQMIIKSSTNTCRMGIINQQQHKQQHQQTSQPPQLFSSLNKTSKSLQSPPPPPFPIIVNNNDNIEVNNCVISNDKNVPADYEIKVVNTD